jgi:hypothetical protein
MGAKGDPTCRFHCCDFSVGCNPNPYPLEQLSERQTHTAGMFNLFTKTFSTDFQMFDSPPSSPAFFGNAL